MVSQVCLLPLFLSCFIVGCAATEYWVRPDSTSHCNTRQPCLALSEYVQNTSHYFSSNSVLHFLSGNHTISKTTWVIVQDVENISLVGSAGHATVQCNGRLSFTFWRVHDLQISNVGFIGCGLEIRDDLRYKYAEIWPQSRLPIYQVKVALLLVQCSSVVLENVTVNESYGYGLLGYNTIMAELNHCLFHHNYWRSREYQNTQHSRANDNNPSENKAGGNALFKLEIPMLYFDRNSTKTLSIFHSEFAHGINQYESSGYSTDFPGGGLGIDITRSYNSAVQLASLGAYNITIYNCSMYNNTALDGANMFLSVRMPLKSLMTVHIISCKFIEGNSIRIGGGFMLQMFIWTYQYPRYSYKDNQLPYAENFRVYLTNSELYGNVASEGGGLYVGVECAEIAGNSVASGGIFTKKSVLFSDHCAEENVHIIFIIQQCICHDNVARNGSGMYLSTINSRMSLTIYNLTFARNLAILAGGAIYIDVVANVFADHWGFTDNTFNGAAIIDLFNSTFIQNAAHSVGSAVYVRAPVVPKVFQLTLISTIFYRNVKLYNFRRKYDCSVLYLSYVKNITLVNSDFKDNNCTSIVSQHSIFHLQGTVGFYRNRGHSGGALAFHHDAMPTVSMKNFMILNPHTSVYIVNNTAVQYGGGILADDKCTRGRHYCFFQTGNLNYTQMDARVVMDGNRAGKAGDSIFGGCLNFCLQKTLSLSDDYETTTFLTPEIFSSLFEIHRQTQSEIAASPQKVCICDGNQLEGSFGYNYRCYSEGSISIFRGGIFLVSAMTVGWYAYASPALVRTVIAPGDSGELEEQQGVQELGNMCANLTYSVRSSQEFIKLHLSVESQMDDNIPHAVISISFRPCPLGFNLSDNPPKCDCTLQLRKPGIKCNINTQLIHRPALVWIGNYSDEVVVHTNCPFDYCKPKDNGISLYEQDQQCAFNRSGVLCGACQPGLSLALGSSQCMQCSNIYILLIIPFALAGVVLIVLMLKCNLTVSTGTLNGLIFYANIVRENHAVFFPLGRSGVFSSFPSVFIAWLNLDLGVEVCFFQGMDAYIRTWLQFVFPVYIWILVGFMICSSRYSTTIARLSGSNTVSVLATLFLLSYAKLLRTIIASISFTTLTDRHGNTSAVWLLDGNMPAMKGSHIPLVVMSIVTLVVYVLPFTMLVLLGPCLQSRSNHRLLQWVIKIKPLLDAYQGPYRDKFRYWTGLLLLVRIVLFAIFGGNALGDPRINLFAITVVVATLLVFWLIAGKVYKTLWMKLLESFFLLNLIILATATLFLKSLEGFSVVKKQAVLTSIMVGSSALVFIGILAYHCFQEVTKKSVLFKYILAKCVALVINVDHDRGCAENSEGISDGSTAAVPQQPTVSVIAMNELREPLLTGN